MESKGSVVRCGFFILVVWTLGIGVSCIYTVQYIRRFAIGLAREEARSFIEETILFKAWNAMHGGVYVSVSPTTPPNPYLEVPERYIKTPSGKLLTRIDPAYMIIQVFELQKKRLGIQGHITSLKPINPQNAPDEWERKALILFEQGKKEYWGKVTFRGGPAIRLMLPLVTEKACLKCHAKQGYKLGDIRGGISVFVPLKPYLLLERREIARSVMVDLFLWIAGLLLIFVGTTRLSAELTKLSMSEYRFRAVFENSPEPMFIFDGEKISDCNRAMLEILGCQEVSQILVHPAELSPEQQPDGVPSFKKFNHWASEVLMKEKVTFKWLFRRFDGIDVWVDAVASRIPKENNRGFVMLVACRDVTKETMLQEQVLQLRKVQALGELAGGIAHDFNNILAIVVGSITMAREFGVSKKADEMLKKAERAVLRAATLTRKLITFSPGGVPVNKVVSLKELLGESVQDVLKKDESGKVRISLDISPELCDVKGDYHQLLNAFTEIITNAKESMPGGGTVYVRAENITVTSEGDPDLSLPEGRYVAVRISDAGSGIPIEHQKRIFDPFFTTKEMGRGLGLSIAYSVVKRHGGEIEVESVLGEGSTFTVLLPAADSASEVCFRGNGKVLVMEDDPYQKELFCTLLSNLGYCVVAVDNGKEAVEKFKEAKDAGAPFDVIILDLLMPEESMDGKETCQAILEVDPDAKVIITSVASSDKAVTDFKDYGFVGALPKPFTLQELAQAVARAMNGKKPKF